VHDAGLIGAAQRVEHYGDRRLRHRAHAPDPRRRGQRRQAAHEDRDGGMLKSGINEKAGRSAPSE
jgi:hypothetical protein